MKTAIEPGTLLDGTHVWRMRCTRCGRHGVWLKDLATVEKHAALHDAAVHSAQLQRSA